MSQTTNRYAVIMAGGVGSRFWPASREARPKQFLDILGTGQSLLQLTWQRFRKILPAENILIVTNEKYRELIKDQLPEAADAQILGEPSRNNTAPCIAWTAFHLLVTNPEAVMVVAPSDHLIQKETEFLDRIQAAFAFAEKNEALITLGIQPTRPDTGYGYIRYERLEDSSERQEARGETGVLSTKTKEPGNQSPTTNDQLLTAPYPVKAFVEKPDKETAKAYLESGEYLWNAGIFIWSAESILNAFRKHAVDIYDLFKEGRGIYGTPGEGIFIRKHYPESRSISIDFAIMEKADNVYTFPADVGWSDLGTWASLHAVAAKDPDINLVQAAPVQLQGARDNLIRAPKDKLVVIGGLEDYIVVDEEDVLLIFPKSREQEIKALRKDIEEKGWDQYL